jgi:hypothetical protein
VVGGAVEGGAVVVGTVVAVVGAGLLGAVAATVDAADVLPVPEDAPFDELPEQAATKPARTGTRRV